MVYIYILYGTKTIEQQGPLERATSNQVQSYIPVKSKTALQSD